MIKFSEAKLKCAKLFGLYLLSFGCFISLYSKLIGWVMEGRKCATTGGDQALLIEISS